MYDELTLIVGTLKTTRGARKAELWLRLRRLAVTYLMLSLGGSFLLQVIITRSIVGLSAIGAVVILAVFLRTIPALGPVIGSLEKRLMESLTPVTLIALFSGLVWLRTGPRTPEIRIQRTWDQSTRECVDGPGPSCDQVRLVDHEVLARCTERTSPVPFPRPKELAESQAGLILSPGIIQSAEGTRDVHGGGTGLPP
jgi:hypothetical protein